MQENEEAPSEKQAKRPKKGEKKEKSQLEDIFTDGFVKELTKYNLQDESVVQQNPIQFNQNLKPVKTENQNQFSMLISNISKVDQTLRASLILPDTDQTRCSFL